MTKPVAFPQYLFAAAVCLAGCSTKDNLGNHVFGEPRWSIALGSSGSERATAAMIDPIGNVLVAGTCGGSVDFGSGPVDCYGSFIAQRDSETGAEQWTARIPDARVSRIVRVANDIHVMGTRPGLDGTFEQFVAVLEDTGQLRSSQDLGLAGVMSPVGVLAADGSVFTTGGVNSAPNDPLADPEALDIALAAHHANGSYAWSTTFAGEGRQLGTAITVGVDGDIVLLVEATDSFRVGTKLVEVAQPMQMILRLRPSGDLVWAQPMPHVVQQLALTPSDAVVLGGCPSTGMLDGDGESRWRFACKDPIATFDSVAVSSDGLIVFGGHHADAAGEDGELFLVAFDDGGNVISAARSTQYAEPSDSRVDAIAVEPTGEVVFVTTATHAFDFGNGLLPYAGEEDVVVTKLDSSTGRDGQVLLARTLP